jgi:hypothetical protein
MATEKRLKGYDPITLESFTRHMTKHREPYDQYDMGYVDAVEQIENFLEYNTVDAVEVVHGRWVLTVHEEQCNFRWNVTAECSECQHSKGEIYDGHFSGFPKHIVESLIPIYAKEVKLDNYCPNCGAKMDGERKDNG